MTGAVVHATALADYVRDHMVERGITNPTRLAAKAGLAHETVRRIFAGVGHPSETTIEKLAAAIGGSIPQMRLLAGRPAGELEPFVLPPEANQLGAREREVVRSMVQALLDASDRRTDIRSDPSVSGPTHSAPRLVGRLRDPDGPT
jgi:hypothetical protein